MRMLNIKGWGESKSVEGRRHKLFNYKDTKAKCRNLEKFSCKGTLRQVFIGMIPPPLPLPSPLHNVYVHVLIHTGKGEGGERRIEGKQFTSWVENTNMVESISSL
jgi:hypothetical protein